MSELTAHVRTWSSKWDGYESWAAVAADSNLLNDDVYARLRELMLSNRLRPGEKLVDRELAKNRLTRGHG